MPLSIDFANLHTILATLYDDMLPLCKDMMDVGKGLAGLGALFYVAVRVWQSMARAEPIDVYPLLRPFAIGICILLFPTLVLGTLNTVLSPIVQGTHKMLEGQTLDMEQYRAQKDAIEHNIGRALQLADKSAYHYYVDFAEKGYYNRLISGNINQVVHVDSVVCDFAAYPYKARTYARQLIIRESNVTERSLVTSCSLQNTGRSDDNPNGFIIEQFTILENRDIRSVER